MKTLKKWLPLAISITVLSGMMYVSVQQNYRQSANDPQIQVAEDLAGALAAGAQQLSLPNTKVDVATTLSTYVMIFDGAGKQLYSSALLGGKDPVIPAGVLAAAKAKGTNMITWQPKAGVRSAIVVKYFVGTNKPGYVMVGRSLREVEKRINNLTYMIGAGWLAALVLSYAFRAWNYRKSADVA